MRACILAIGLLALACQNPGTSSGEFCATPWGVGGDVGCDNFELCVPNTIASCTGNDCCHLFCSVEGCGMNVALVAISPDAIPDGGALGCGCTVADAGASNCSCADAGFPCYLTSCLCVCGS